MSSEEPTGFGQEPRSNPRAKFLTLLIGLVLLVLAGVAIRDVYMIASTGSRESGWLVPVYNEIATADVTAGGVAIGVLVALIGLWLIVAAFKPRPHTHVKVSSKASVWMRPVDVARKSTATMQQEFGADDVRSRADRKRLSVQVGSDDTEQMQEETIHDALRPELSLLEPTPKIKLTVLPPAPKEF